MTLTGTPEMDDDRHVTLSVVVVTRNEADRVQPCIKSVFAACREIDDFEVILVDSNSTDRTVERAAAYPITILRIPTDELSTPGAGRYVGTQYARGEMILFVDGDMVLSETWLPGAISCLRDGDDVAAVDGHLNEPGEGETSQTVDIVRGVALYDSTALDDVGGFDPFIESLEDIHLGFQLTAAGYRLLRTPDVAAEHPVRTKLGEPLRRWRRGYMRGPGQILRRSARSPRLLAKHVSRMRYRLLLLGWLSVGIASLLSPVATIGWFILSVIGFGFVVANQGFSSAFLFVIDKSFGVAGLFHGLRERPDPVDSFPMEAIELVTAGPVHDDPVQLVDD